MLFDADPDYIASLDSTLLVKLLKRLVLAESRLMGIPLRGASVPLQITIADGGEDGRVEWSGGQNSTAYLPARFSAFQSKAQNLSESQVKSEVLKRSRKGPPKLNSAVADVLSKKGAYIVFCRERMVTAKRKKLVKAILTAITEGGGNPKKAAAIEVYDANLIADWVNRHPAVALWLASQKLGRNLAGFQTHEGWGRTPEFSPPWQPSDEPRFAPVNRLVPGPQRKDPKRSAWTYEQVTRHILEFLASEKAIVRVFGPSGFGKSRFVYEVLKSTRDTADQIDTASVIYCDGSISGDEAVKLALELADAELAAIFVVDECPDELHLKLASLVKRINSRLRLVTLDIETKVLRATDTLSVRVERADEKLIKDIANGVSPNLSDRDKSFIADVAEGFPRMAVLAAQQDADGRQTFLSAEQILDRIIWSGKQRVPEAQRALEVASLFDWFGLQGRVDNQAAFLAAELAQMPHRLFVEHLLSFKSRGIITQRGDFIQVGPVPLAARLGLARMGLMTPEQLLQSFQKAPEELQSSLLKRIKWLDTSPTVVAFAQRLLQPDMLGSLAALNTPAGSKMLDRLVHVAPDLVSATIDRVFWHLTTDELKSARDGRRYLVWSLQKLVFRKQTFDRSARLLLRLAVAENENYGNNASGLFKQLFQLYLSGTEADPASRLLILDDGLKASDRIEREICVGALSHMLDSSHYSRTGGAEQIGTADALEDWRPKTYGEIRDFFRAAIARLVSIATSGDEFALAAKRHLGTHIRGLFRQLPVVEVKAMIDTITAHYGFWPEALTGISHWLYFDRDKKAPPEVADEIRRMYDDLLPTNPVDLAVLYTQGWGADFHDPDSTYDRDPKAKHDFKYAARQAVAVAGKIAEDSELINQAVERMACSDGHGLYQFSKELMKRVKNPSTLFDKALKVAEANSQPPNRGFFGGLISSVDERDQQLASTFIRSALQSPKLKGDAIALIGSGSLQADDIALVISLLQSGDITPWQCQNLGLARVDITQLMAILRELERHANEGLWSILDMAGMYLYDGKNTATKELITLLKRVLVTPALMDAVRNNMDGYHMERMVERLAKLGTIDEVFAKKLARQVLRICRQGTGRVFYDFDDPVRTVLGQLVALHPKATWAEVAKKLASRSRYDRFYAENLLKAAHHDDHLARGLSFAVPQDIYLDWVRDNPEARAAIAVSWLPIAEREDSGRLKWHPELEAFVAEFGDQADVLSAISSRLIPTSYWGGLAPHLEPIIPLVESWLSHPNAHARNWAASQLDWLRKTIVDAMKRSEEDVVRFT
jgi:hypothetical protein